MFRRFGGYVLIYFVSFGFFTAVLHTFAFANIDKEPPKEGGKKEAPEKTLQPTPTIYFAPTKSISPGPSERNDLARNTTNVLETDFLNTPAPTKTKSTPTAIQIILPTNTPAPTSVVTPTNTPAPALTVDNQTASGGMSADRLFEMANAHRRSIGVPELKKDDKTCALASARAGEIEAELDNGTLHSGMYGRNLPYWNTENAIAMGPEEAAFAWWLSDYIHRKAIENPTYTTSCTACSGVYCVQEFTSYQPK